MSGRRRGTRVRKVSAVAAEAAAGADSDDEDEETLTTHTDDEAEAAATVTPEKKKKKRAPIVKLETLIQEKNWTEIRKRLKRVASPKRIGSLLHYTADNPDVPDDIFRLFFSKLQGKREFTPEKGAAASGGKPWSIRHEFWNCVCNVNADDVYTKKFGNVCKHRSPTSLNIFLNEYATIVGTLHKRSARETILDLWKDYLFPNGNASFAYQEQKCPKTKQDELLRVTSKQDLVDNECNAALYDVWTKTELLIQMTVTNGLKKQVDEGDDNEQDADDNNNNNKDVVFPLIHTLIQVEVPKFIVWFALKLYPEQTQVLDELGRFPLHWAAALNNCETESYFYVSFDQIDGLSMYKDTKNNNAKTTTTTMVELVFNAFPAGAGHADKNGSHPLALLLDLDYKTWTTNDWTSRCVMLLLKQAPEALQELNGENQMLPFLTAACMHAYDTWRERGKEEALEKSLRQLNLSYEILRQDPTVVSRGVKATLRELYLQQQLNEAQDVIGKLRDEQRKLQDKVDMLLLKMKKNDRHDDNNGAGTENANDDDDACFVYDVESASSHQKRRSKRIRLNHGGYFFN